MLHKSLSLGDFRAVLSAHEEEVSAEGIFLATEKFCRAQFGFMLLTVLRYFPASGEIERVYSTDLENYPLGGRKQMGGTPWGTLVQEQGKAWLGKGANDFRWAYPDAEKSLSMGRETSLCIPIRVKARTIGVLSLSAERDRYTHQDVENLRFLSPFVAHGLQMLGTLDVAGSTCERAG
ncbi:GAF domain-containing protein [Marivita sp. S6314]|uniref:GAF domain-containing protein n=1 Tax=Marivita sp. S6314 TaxID=2926406 RepID=UPI001FF4E8BB|nr:GAF domain-containing protein [Marivita sp. S6314]MCK0150842.1 GAF domain-containing protein [Marivita sp. S6314]